MTTHLDDLPHWKKFPLNQSHCRNCATRENVFMFCHYTVYANKQALHVLDTMILCQRCADEYARSGDEGGV